MKKVKLFLFIVLVLGLSISVSFATFLIVNNKMSTNISNVEVDKFKITFTDNDTVVKTMYIDSGYNLSLKDAPYYFDNGGNPICWSASGQVLNDVESINSNVNFIAGNFSSTQIDSNNYNNSNGNNPSVAFNDLNQEKYVYSGSFEMYYDGRNTNFDDPGKLVDGNKDHTIGFSSQNQNHYTLTLNRDIILSGYITIGASTGYYDSNGVDFSQICYQGFIIGNYCTLDLNGHDLIVGNPKNASDFNKRAMLDAWGEVKDSSGDGTLLLDSSARMYVTMVLEDVYHEKRIPYTYYTNDNIFSMYRCPYWTCNSKIISGAIVMCKYRMDLGGNNSNCAHGDILMIGNSSTNSLTNLTKDSLIQLDSGYINRYITKSIDLDENNDTIKNDLLYQKINYEVYDANVILNKFKLKFEYSGMNAELDSSSYDFFISPYYSFYLYNTNFNLNQHLVFMPGSYLYVDNYSKINMSYNSYQEQEGFSQYLPAIIKTLRVPDKDWQAVASFTFIDALYKMDDLKPVLNKLYKQYTVIEDFKIVTKTVYLNTEGYSCKIFQNSSIISNFWNKLSAAYADIYGEITFIKQNYTQYRDIQFGGEINIYNTSSFINNYNTYKDQISIKLYSSTFKTDWCRIIGGSGATLADRFDGEIYRDVTGYYNYPLISNGYVMCKLDGTNGINDGYYKYDYLTRTIYNEKNINETYVWIFADDKIDNLSLCSNIESSNSLNGSFKPVTVSFDGNNYKGEINYLGNTYIIWHGAYIRKSGNQYYVGKFFDNSRFKDYLNANFTYTSRGVYTLNS